MADSNDNQTVNESITTDLLVSLREILQDYQDARLILGREVDTPRMTAAREAIMRAI